MSSNTSKGKAEKGSKFWMQMVVNDNELKAKLHQAIGCDLGWLSPLKEENYSEYELRQQTILEKLHIDNQNKNLIRTLNSIFGPVGNRNGMVLL